MQLSVDTMIGIAGIVVAVIFGIWGARSISRRRISQNQTVTNGSTGIQSTGDTHVHK